MIVLGIETSCDDSGLAIYDGYNNKLLGHILHIQTSTHELYGGVVPELASRDHIKKITPLLKELLLNTNLTLKNIDAIAYTKGPGLAGALLVGASFAQSLSYALKKPSIGIHHLEGHILAAQLETETLKPPFLSLLVSGGHTMLIRVNEIGDYQILGETLDDAAGEAFDKTAKLLGFSYPGGKTIAERALLGTPEKFTFPRPLINRPTLDFSFSGLKTHVLNTILQLGGGTNSKCSLTETTKNDICFAFEDAVTDVLVAKSKMALEKTGLKQIVIAGGVGANLKLREKMNNVCKELKVNTFYPKIEFCTDNGAMIAYAGFIQLNNAHNPLYESNAFAIEIFPRLPLDTRCNSY